METVKKFDTLWSKREANSNTLYTFKDENLYNTCQKWYMLVQDENEQTIYLAFHNTSKDKTNIISNIRTSTYSKKQKLYEAVNITLKSGARPDYDTIFENKILYAIPDQHIDVICKIDQNLRQYLLIDLLNKYNSFKNSSQYDEQYKWDYAEQHLNIFNNLDDFENKIKNLGNYNFMSYFMQRSGLAHLMEPYNIETFKAGLTALYDESTNLSERIKDFLDILKKLLQQDANWKNKKMLPDETDASYFLFTNNYQKYLLFNPKTAFNNFAKKLNLTDLTDKSDKIDRYVKFQNYCKESLIPLMDKTFNKQHSLLDAQDFIRFTDKNTDLTYTTDTEQNKERSMQDNIPLNQILYGPPGTGKTYNTVVKAMEIINPECIKRKESGEVSNYSEIKAEFDKAKANHQIEFVTFHQSYSYEEFVEGIKPDLNDSWDEPVDNLTYKGSDGIFKKICKNARQIKNDKSSSRIDFTKTRIFKMSLGKKGNDNIYNYCLSNNVVALGWGGDKDFSNCHTTEDFQALDNSWGATAVERFKNWMRIGDIILISNGNSYIRAIAQITDNYKYDNNTEIEYSQFRPVKWLYSGEDIPVSKFFDRNLSGQAIYAFYSSGREGKEDYNSTIDTNFLNEIITGNINNIEQQPYVLIIDEINRGNISKIFGELITLIEKDKRETLSVTLPYSQESFTVPNNLYIIGTMNTSDRSIASIDIALRRRFVFKEMMPDANLIPDINVYGISLRKIFTTLNNRISVLLDRDHQIGHSYFIKLEESQNPDSKFQQIWFDCIMPLLNEYFYGDWEKLRALLGEARTDGTSFIKKINKVTFATDYSLDEEESYDFVSNSECTFEAALRNLFKEK